MTIKFYSNFFEVRRDELVYSFVCSLYKTFERPWIFFCIFISQNDGFQVKYHEEFEKSKGHRIQVADDPELTRHLQNTKIQSQVPGIMYMQLSNMKGG